LLNIIKNLVLRQGFHMSNLIQWKERLFQMEGFHLYLKVF